MLQLSSGLGGMVLHGTSGMEGAERAPASHRGLGSAAVTTGIPATAPGVLSCPSLPQMPNVPHTRNSTMDSAEIA